MRTKTNIQRLIAIACTCGFAATAGAGQVIYVDAVAGGAGTGASWQDACNHLQDALRLAAAVPKPLEIRVAQGVYKPDQGAGIMSGHLGATFQLLNGVSLLGGYAGAAAPNPDARDVKLYETVLSGDLADDDVEVEDANSLYESHTDPTRVDNAFHVVTGSGTDRTAVLDGFVIAAGDNPPSRTARPDAGLGAGLYNDAGSPSIRGCTVRACLSSKGGGVYNRDGSPVFSDCTFERNSSRLDGGAMYNENSSPVVSGCLFSRNAAWNQGGAIMNARHSRPDLQNCTFTDNETHYGGAMYNDADSAGEVQDCVFERNRAIEFGQGGAVSSRGSLTLARCTFRRNSAMHGGGAIYAHGGTLEVSDCAFSGNTMERRSSLMEGGGAVFSEWDTVATITNSTFVDNTAPNGGAVYSYLAYAKICGCRFRDNMALMPSRGSLSRHGLGSGGGAVLAHTSVMKLTDCDFQGNRAWDAGGALQSDRISHLLLVNCVLAGNWAEAGGAVYTGVRDLRLRNCTLASNIATDGAVVTDAGALTHCIVWEGDSVLADSIYPITAVYCDIEGGYPGHGNVDLDPLFVRPGRWAEAQDPNVTVGPDEPNAVWVAGDYHLQSQAGHWDEDRADWVRDPETSPCIDAGDPGTPTGAESFPNGGILNLGAYGGTAEASRSYFGAPICETEIPGDLNGDCKVDITDTVLASQEWRQSPIPPSSQPPAVVITAPVEGAVIEVSPAHPTILITAEASDPDGTVIEVKFSIEQRTETGSRRTSSTDSDGANGWQWRWNLLEQTTHPYAPGPYTVTAWAIDDDCEIAFAPEVHITVTVAQ
jgi:predicted outer membrane repeat protein